MPKKTRTKRAKKRVQTVQNTPVVSGQNAAQKPNSLWFCIYCGDNADGCERWKGHNYCGTTKK